MTTPALVWLIVGLLTITVVLVMLIAFVRHLIVLYRSAARFQSEAAAIGEEISRLGDRRRPLGAPRGVRQNTRP